METDSGKMLNRTAIYGFGGLLRGLTSFLMLPIYTRFLTPSDYGTIELLNIAIDMAAMLFGARITAGMFRFYQMESHPDNKHKVITTSLYTTGMLNGLCILFIVLFSTQISQLVFGAEGYAYALSLFSLTLLFAAVGEVGMGYLRIEDRPYVYVGLSILKLAFQLSLNIYFVVYKEMAFMGVIYSALISGVIMFSGLGIYIFSKTGYAANWKLVRPMITFSMPIIFSSYAMFFIAFGDRYLLRIYHDINTVGIYALAYKFGAIYFSLIWAPFMTYWESKQYEFTKTEEGKK